MNRSVALDIKNIPTECLHIADLSKMYDVKQSNTRITISYEVDGFNVGLIL